METCMKEDFYDFRKTIDDNPYDLSGFITVLSERYPDINQVDIDEIKDFIEQEMEIESDQEICEINDEKIEQICEYVNQLLKYLYDD